MLVLWLQFQNHRYVTSIEAVVVDGMLETWLGILMKKYGCNLNAWFFLVRKPDLVKFYQLTFLTVVFFFHLVVGTGTGTPFCVGRLPTPPFFRTRSPMRWKHKSFLATTIGARKIHVWQTSPSPSMSSSRCREDWFVGLIFGWDQILVDEKKLIFWVWIEEISKVNIIEL